MKLTDYHRLRTGIQRNASPGSPDDAAEMGQRLRAALLATDLFHSVEVDRTDDLDRLVIGLAEFAPDVDPVKVAWHVERVWHDVLAYPFWSAECVLVDEGHVELQAATRASQLGHYLTLHVVAQATVPAQRPGHGMVPAQGGPVEVQVPAQSSPSSSMAAATPAP